MSEPEHIQEKNNTRYWWLLPSALVLLAFAVILTFAIRNRTGRSHVTITVDTNGNARLYGVPLLTTNMRDKTFSAMNSAGVKAALVVPPSTTTNEEQRSNVIEMLKVMGRAGLLKTNSSPYE